MDAARWVRLNDVFHQARALAPDAHGPWLTAACGDDDVLRAEVIRLLAADAARTGGSMARHSRRVWSCSDGTGTRVTPGSGSAPIV